MTGNRRGEMTDSQTYFHGTKADLEVGDLIEPGYASNYGRKKQATFVYLAATLDAAIWGAELAVGAGRGRIYISRYPLRIIGEVAEWTGHSPGRLKAMHDRLEILKQLGIEAIEE